MKSPVTPAFCPGNDPLSVLVVDDEEDNRKLMRAILEAEGMRVNEAVDGVDALESLRREISDVVITDIRMPRMDGYRLCNEVRTNARWRGISIIACTGSLLSSSDHKVALEMGADDFLRKPSSPRAIVEAVRRVEAAAACELGRMLEHGEKRAIAEMIKQGKRAAMARAGLPLKPQTGEPGPINGYDEHPVAGTTGHSAELDAAHRRLRESEDLFRQMTESIDEVFWMTNPEMSQMLYVSPAYERIWGRTCADLYARPRAWLESIVPEDRERVLGAIKHPEQDSYRQEYRIQRPDGSVRWVSDRGYKVRDAAGDVCRLVGVAADITEQKSLQVHYLRSQRVECLGRLAAGIAHDLNNILAPIIMGAPLLRMGLTETDAARTLATIEKSAQRGVDLVKQLLLFGQGADGERVPLRLQDSVREVEEMLANTLPKSISVGSSLPRDLALVMADPTQIHQVLLNLCVNARDAMSSSGTLTLKAENAHLNEYAVQALPGAKQGDYVIIRVTDTGTGIAPGIVDRIFDPFFTTKEIGKGTGLGLATVHEIATNHGGFVTVDSQIGKGSTFSVYFPALASGATLVPASGEPLPVSGHGEEILVVDDEEPIRTLLSEILTKHGYLVHTAADGIDGAAVFLKHASAISLVITDLSMPRLDGATLAQLIRKLNPTLPILISTGAASGEGWSELLAEIERLGVTAVMQKPFTIVSILGAMHSALAKKAA